MAPPPGSLVAPLQIQKLADRYDVMSEVPKCSIIQKAEPAEGVYNAPPDPIADGSGLATPPKNPAPAVGPSGLVSTVSGSNPLQSWQPSY